MTMQHKIKDEDWYHNHEILGHTMAREQFEKFEEVVDKYAKTDFELAFVKYITSDIVTWNYWVNNITNKFVANMRYALKRIENGNFTELLRHHNQNTGMLKNDMTWALEYLAYLFDREEYVNYYCTAYAFYGLNRDDAVIRMHEYFEKLYKKYPDLKEFVDMAITIMESR